MKTYALALVFSALSFSTFAATAPAATAPAATNKSRSPRYYIMMKHGKLIEVSKGHRLPVRKNITLTNETTIHPNGGIDAGSGENLQLKEGQYITMDGKIRNLKDMPHPASRH
jgi:hypothetical protein